MKCFLSKDVVLKWLEAPSVYHLKRDELYELDEESFLYLTNSSNRDCSKNERDFIDYCLKEGILVTTETFPKKHPPLMKSPEPSLRYLELQVTERCNLRCRHCYIKKDILSELPVDAIRSALREFEEMQGLRVMITGGEPLLHRNFSDINALLPEFSLRKILFTNGLLLRRELLEGLAFDEIQVSVDGMEESHDALRGKDTFRKAMEAIELALSIGFEVSVATMVHAKNLADFEEMEHRFIGMGIKEWTVDVPCVAGRLQDNREFEVGPEEGGKFLSFGFGEGYHSGSPGFACGPHLMSVMANGRVAKCSFYEDQPAGKIGNGLRACWHRIKPVRLAELACDCGHIESCRGGCRYRAALLGDPYGKDLYRCFLYDTMK